MLVSGAGAAALAPGAVGALLGLAAGVGTVLVLAAHRARRVTLDQRLAPYLRAQRRSSGLLGEAGSGGGRGADLLVARGAGGTLQRLLAPVVADAAALVARVGRPGDELARRLVRAGGHRGVEEFRAEQVVHGAVGLAGGLAAALVLGVLRGGSPLALALLAVLAGAAGVLLPDVRLTAHVRRREARILLELPTVAELLALAVGAGEGAAGALDRVVRTTHGPLAAELGAVLAEARTGTPLTVALDRLARRTGVPALARFAEAVSVAVDRGTPLGDVLRAQAQDVREEGRRALMEAGGRKEVQMMVPVVFLLLPVTVLFAVFPSAVVLQVGL
ncbi:tight adherence protein C [Cellulomonas marina]|uniref:Tight adherence protein C n=1 Tax=Cellulomonas marina TaxID=988821 RepID=A0A1I0V1I0_9CELL|nr:tight adherence protein C [Cellulomonas marina]